MNRQWALLAVLVVVIGLGAYQFNKKSVSLGGANFGDMISQLFKKEEPENNARTIEQAQADQAAREEEENGPPKAYPNPEIRPATAAEMFPFPADVKPLTATVPMPEKKKPVIYFALATDGSDKYTTPSTVFRDMVKFQIRSTGGAELLANTIPNVRMLWINRKEDFNIEIPVSFEESLYDANALGCDVMVCMKFDGPGQNANLQMQLHDLRSSRTESWNSADANVKLAPELIGLAAEKALLFTGIDQAAIDKAQVKSGIPSAAIFDQLCSQPISQRNYESRMELVNADPESPYLYSESTGTTSCVQLVDMGLKRFSNDQRLICEKLYSLNDSMSTEPLIRFLGESIRRYPDDFFVYSNCNGALKKVYPQWTHPHKSPPELKAVVKQYEVLADKYKDNWGLSWSYAWSLQHLGGYMRGTKTIDRIPRDVLAERGVYLSDSFDVAMDLWKRFPDSPTILNEILEFDSDLGRLTTSDRKEIAKKLEVVNPKSVNMELTAAQEHSIGYGRQADYFRIIDRAVKRHAGDPKAMAILANAVRFEGWRQVGWKEMTQDQLIKTSNPYANRFWDAAEFVYSQNESLNKESDSFYYAMAEARGRTDIINGWKESGKNSCFSFRLAHEAHSAGKWEDCLKYAQASFKEDDTTDERHQCLYYIVKSLWKLKRYDESLKYARKGILMYPKRQTFFYMYAIVALEADKNLETAFDCAWAAVDFDTKNQGCNDTFEKLRLKLKKPEHPALVAMKN